MKDDRGCHQIYTLRKKKNFTGDASIFQAELIATQEAAKHLTVNKDTWGLYIKFFSDSQAALQALKSNTCKAQTVKDTHDAVNNLAAQTKLVSLTWIKAHIGLDGNELADEYAELGTVDHTNQISTLTTYKEQQLGIMSTTNGKKNGEHSKSAE